MEPNAEAPSPGVEASMQPGRAVHHSAGDDDMDKVDGEPIDWSKHTYGGLGTLHDGERLLHEPWGRAGPATFAAMQRRAEEQRAWVPCPPRLKEGMLPRLGLDPQAAALATMMCLGTGGRNVRMRTSFIDTSYSFFCIGATADHYEGTLVEITALKFSAKVDLQHGALACMNTGECVIALADGATRATLIRWPELSSHPTGMIDGQLRVPAAASRKQRTCAACGQVWHQTMRRCAACNEVAYCSPVCQRHHWSRHKAACKRARARERLKYDPTVIG